ncbi:phage antirepressor protein [Streptococcus saliviloxodontae]|uniref:Uncharacterized protein n=1 Tax=Streptococcus saliviloxodontae TaxID=1349416 RepID=A0ABS2PJH8_9STRE|nr:phage antirepressor protein [Streptococcus saliviloxodontae]MBM7635583.1 hypothetical protein [Streptococcus saliviloxodontae]
MTNQKQQVEYTAITFEELKEWVDENVEFALLVQEFYKCVPMDSREQFQGLTQSVYDCLESFSEMLNNKTLIYSRELEQARLNAFEQKEQK